MKISLPMANVANLIADHVAKRFPILAANPGSDIWFTGSQIWQFIYPDLPLRDPPLASDWDIFALNETAGATVVSLLGLVQYPACKTAEKRHGAERTVSIDNVPVIEDDEPDKEAGSYNDGYSYLTPDGEIDVWISRPGNVVGELLTYPQASHAHCRVAFSFSDGLVILPNEMANQPTPSLPTDDEIPL